MNAEGVTSRSHVRRWQWSALLAVAALYVAIAAFNAVLIYDDPLLIVRFQQDLQQDGVFGTLKILFIGLDMENEYRLYGLSRVIHFCLWLVFGSSAPGYGAVIALIQLVSGLGIYRIIRCLGFDTVQAGCPALLWVLSPFAVTACFHHYSYLVLPYAITIGCALVLQSLHRGAPMRYVYPGLAALGLAIAWTGEAHIAASIVILVCVGLGTPSARPKSRRWRDVAVPVVAVVAGVLIHRLIWQAVAPPLVGFSRFVPQPLTMNDAIHHFATFLRSLRIGVSVQITPILQLRALWIVVAFLAIALAVHRTRLFRPSPQTAVSAMPLLSVGMLLILLASLAIYGVLSVVTFQAFSDVFPRRYGFVPNTLLLMAIGAVVSEPRFRVAANFGPTILSAVTAAFWLVLVVGCLPAIRREDRGLVAEIAAASAMSRTPYVYFADAWERPMRPDYMPVGPTPGARGAFPEVFESPFQAYWSEAAYALALFGADGIAFRAERGDGDSTILHLWRQGFPTVTIAPQSLVVVANIAPSAPSWRHALDSVTVTQGVGARRTLSRLECEVGTPTTAPC
jgi:hypothetical protein